MKAKEIAEQVGEIEGWLSRQEGFFLYSLARKIKKGSIVEIGSWKGKSTIWLAGGAVGKTRVYAIDPHTGCSEKNERVNTYPEFVRNVKKMGLWGKIIPLIKTSAEASAGFSGPIDLLFIDGSHVYQEVKRDILLWLPRLREGSWLLIHDASVLRGPWKAARNFILFSSSFSHTGMVGSIVFGKYLPSRSIWSKLGSTLRNIAIYFYIALYKFLRPFPFPKEFRSSVRRKNLKAVLKKTSR